MIRTMYRYATAFALAQARQAREAAQTCDRAAALAFTRRDWTEQGEFAEAADEARADAAKWDARANRWAVRAAG